MLLLRIKLFDTKEVFAITQMKTCN